MLLYFRFLYESARGSKRKGPFSKAEIADDLMLRRQDAKHKASGVPMGHHMELRRFVTLLFCFAI